MSENVSFGKSSGLFFNNLKGGVKRENLKSEDMKSIFDKVDTDKNGFLDDSEVRNFAQILDKNNSNFLDKNEAKNYIKNFGLMTMTPSGQTTAMSGETIMQFLQEIQANTEGITSTKEIKKDGVSYIEVQKEDGSKETINTEDKSSVKVSKDSQGNAIEECFNADKKLISKTVTDSNGNIEETTYSDNGTPKTTVKKETGGNSVTTVQYDDTGAPKTKEVKKGVVTNSYEYTENGEERLTSTVKNEGHDVLEEKTSYSYSADGTVTKNIKQAGKETTQILLDGTDLLNEVIVEDNKVTSTTFNEEGNKTSQSVTIDGKTYDVEYDGKGNTYITVQNNESATSIVNQFGKGQFSVQDVLNLNSNKVHGGGFLVGEKILIPTELDADNKALQGRTSTEQAINTFSTVAAPLLQEVDARKQNIVSMSYNDCNTFEEVAKKLYEQEGVSYPSKEQIRLRSNELKELNPQINDGGIKGNNLNVTLDTKTYNKNKATETQKFLDTEQQRRTDAYELDRDLYNYLASHHFAANDQEFLNKMDKITPNNVVDVLDQYESLQKNIKNRKSNQNSIVTSYTYTSLIDNINSESGDKSEALEKIICNLEEAAKKAGVPPERIKQDVDGFRANTSNTMEMERYANDLRNVIKETQYSKGTSNVSDTQAADIYANDAKFLNNRVQDEYSTARADDTWESKTGDVVCGWFGCTTVKDMNEELKNYDTDIKELVNLQQKGDIEGFKKQYKKVFGVEFNAKNIAARENAMQRLEEASFYSAVNKQYRAMNMHLDNIPNDSNMWYKLSPGASGEDLKATVEAYAKENGLPFDSYKDQKEAARKYINDGINSSSQSFYEASGGRSIKELAADVQHCNDAAFGSHGDKLPDIQQFNKNMKTTGYVVEGIEDIALSAVTGGASTAVKSAKVSKYLGKYPRITKAYNKTQQAVNTAKNTKVGKVATSAVNSKPGQMATSFALDTGKDMLINQLKGEEVSITDSIMSTLTGKIADNISEGMVTGTVERVTKKVCGRHKNVANVTKEMIESMKTEIINQSIAELTGMV